MYLSATSKGAGWCARRGRGATKDFTIAITRSAQTIKHALQWLRVDCGDECGTASHVAAMRSVYIALYVVGIATGSVELAANRNHHKTTELTTTTTTAAAAAARIRIDGHASSLWERVKFN